MYTIVDNKYILFVLIFLSLQVHSSSIIYGEGDMIELTPGVKYITDPSRALSREQVGMLPSGDWQPLPSPNPLFTNRDNAYWLHFSVTNTSSSPLFLNIPYPFHDEIDLYLSSKARNWALYTSGFARPAGSRTLPIHSHNFFLAAPGQSVEAYMRIKGNWVSIPILQAASAEQLYQKESKLNIWEGIYAGIMLALFIYNFNLWVSLREPVYGFYLLYLLSVFLISFHHAGLTCQYLWPCDEWKFFDTIVNAAIAPCAILFTQSFLQLRKNAFKLNTALWIIMAIQFIYLIIMRLEGGTALAGQILEMTNNISPVLLISGAVYVYFKKKYSPALYYLLGWSMFLASSVILFRIYGGNIRFDPLLFNILELGSAGEAMLFSFALADRIRVLRKEKRIAESEKSKQETEMKLQTLKNDRQLLETEIKTQELERARLAADLHDELGLSLTLAKMALQDGQSEKVDQQLSIAIANVDQSIVSLREITHNLHPSVIDTFGLVSVVKKVLHNLAQKHSIEVNHDIDPDITFPVMMEIHVYRVFTELINNILKHAQATQINVSIGKIPDNGYFLSVSDNGNGMAKDVLLRGISARLKFLKGEYVIHDHLEQGTKITITFPAG